MQFSTAATATVQKTEGAFQMAEQVHQQREILEYAGAPLSEQGPDLTPILPPDKLAAEDKALNAIKQYATLLAEVSGNAPIHQLQVQVGAAQTAFAGLSSSLNGSPRTSEEGNLAGDAISAIGSEIIARKRNRALPGIIAKMEPVIHHLCLILENEIGTVENGRAGGITGILVQDYKGQIVYEVRFIYSHKKLLTPVELRGEKEKLAQLYISRQKAMKLLSATYAAVQDLDKANSSLAKTSPKQRHAPKFRAALVQLTQDLNQLNSL